MAIISKFEPGGSGATIVRRSTTHYDPETFAEFKQPMFNEATAKEVLDNIQPMKFDFLPGREIIAVDTETYYTGVPSNRMPSGVCRRWIKQSNGKHIPTDFPFCISISDGHNSFVVYDTLENHFAEFRKLAPLFEDSSVDKTGHNIDYDLHMLANCKVNLKGRLYDTMHTSKLTRASAFTHRLFDIASEIQNFDDLDPDYAPTILTFERMVDSYKAQYRITDYRQLPKDLMVQYTSADTWNTIWALKMLYPMLIENDQIDIFDKESEMLLVAFQMERAGIKLDLDYEDIIIPELQKESDDAERKIYETAGCVFNINSSQQLEQVLQNLGYGHLIHYKKPTDIMLSKGITKGNASFNKIEMDRLDNEGVPLIKDIQTYRAAEKLLNTFAIKLYEMRDAAGYVHCNINTIEAKTGRFSMSDPSMQNMPRRKDSRIRAAFIPPEGYTLYDLDFKSQESIILVHYSRSQYLSEIIHAGKDIHKAVATIIYSLPYEEVSKELRDVSKSVEFAIVYGAGPSKVADMTGLSLEEATVAMKTFLHNAPEIDTFIRTANKVAKERRMIRTIKNRHVYVERGREYACVNYIIQGSAADSTKTRMVNIYKFLKANNLKTYMVLQVHDSLLQCVAKEEEDFILGWLCWLQEERELFRVPVTVDVARCTPTWRDKEDIDIPAVKPPEDMLEKMNNYDIWKEGIL